MFVIGITEKPLRQAVDWYQFKITSLAKYKVLGREGETMSGKCPVCKVEQKGLCIHEKIMLGMMGVAVVSVVLVLIF